LREQFCLFFNTVKLHIALPFPCSKTTLFYKNCIFIFFNSLFMRTVKLLNTSKVENCLFSNAVKLHRRLSFLYLEPPTKAEAMLSFRCIPPERFFDLSSRLWGSPRSSIILSASSMTISGDKVTKRFFLRHLRSDRIS
jgi:hypothetical protein